MFSSPRFLAYVHKPSPYYLRKLMTDQSRKQLLKLLSDYSRNSIVTRSNPVYQRAHQLMLQQKKNELLKYENSFWWSPRYTPNNFIYSFLLPGIAVLCLMLYIRYVAVPKHMMEMKKKLGIRFPQLQKRGWLSGWYEQYNKPDKVLQFQAYTLQDMQRLHKQGLLAKNPEQVIKKIQKKKSKFIKGDRDFVMSQFKTN